MSELFKNMTFDEKIAHIRRCQAEGLEKIRKGAPSCLADIADHLDIWGPWFCDELVDLVKQADKNNERLTNIAKVLRDSHGICFECVEAEVDGYTICGDCSCE